MKEQCRSRTSDEGLEELMFMACEKDIVDDISVPGAQIQVFLRGVYYLQVRIFRRRTDLETAILQTTRHHELMV